MNRFLVALAASLAIGLGGAGAAFAQSAAPPAGAPGGQSGQRGAQRFGQMLLSLGLTDAQKNQIRTIMANARTQNQNVTDPTERRANMRAAFAKIQTVLTPAQQKKLHDEFAAARAKNNAAHS